MKRKKITITIEGIMENPSDKYIEMRIMVNDRIVSTQLEDRRGTIVSNNINIDNLTMAYQMMIYEFDKEIITPPEGPKV